VVGTPLPVTLGFAWISTYLFSLLTVFEIFSALFEEACMTD
jgi:hypothetical protein